MVRKNRATPPIALPSLPLFLNNEILLLSLVYSPDRFVALQAITVGYLACCVLLHNRVF